MNADRRDAIGQLLKKYWGYTEFLPGQEAIIASVLNGNDTLAVLATGSGKSLCYQLPALASGGLTLVVSPLIALMKDQVDDLTSRGIPAAAYNSSLEFRERESVGQELRDNTLRLLFVSPEKCVQPAFLDLIRQTQLGLIAIDEAHCISEWGHDFRPEYRQLAVLKKTFPAVPVIALTATAIPKVRDDIRAQLGLARPREFVGSFNRKNLRYRVVEKNNPLVTVIEYLMQHRGESGIIYCFSKQETDTLAAELKKRGFRAAAYHAGLTKQERSKVQEDFIRDNVDTVCATVAFGMGINKPDVRYVIHYALPKSIESYYQETGRAGRDGLPADCILLYSRGDVYRVRSLLSGEGSGEPHASGALRKLREMADYCESAACRRKYLLTYFGEDFPDTQCGSCDTCEHPRELIDGTEIARTILDCIRQLPGSFGIELITDVLTGTASVKVRARHFDRLPAFKSGKAYTRARYRSWISELVRQGYLARDGDQYPVIRKTARSQEILDGRARVMLPASEVRTGKQPEHPKQPDLPAGSEPLFLHLKQLRKSLADADRVPPYVIFSDRSLRELARLRPADRESFRTIHGVGDRKLEKYGPAFMRAIAEYAAPAPGSVPAE
ncbi:MULTISPECIES: DNA helicase RecQ [unclassified Methanoregula]|uniref:DNA helicase RecQ n=1 Tax=unclassified Methanoregula TaxID=2649730 RepID=UPI0009C7B338|nr:MULTISPECIES: DNA helicase RecQ [unclassified Methanoregula]OPX62538.1 MAG: putative ATP-dependent RNA helicase [Methanoregula sp. PtaB.Bin085]OPY31637.1 MAG: putative ATP-dependent RNA helicase [Methanoregula sp. PtaU1.Bin006]